MSTIAGGRMWTRLLVVGALGAGLLAGCASSSAPLKELPVPFAKNAQDETLRKRVESDSFPTAKQAGL